MASAALGGTALMVSAAGFFLSSTAMVTSVLASIALAGAIGGVVLGAWSLRRPVGEVGVIGLAAGGLTLPLATFDLLVAVTGQLR